MRRAVIPVLALVALIVFAAFGAAGASANPHWYECAKVAGGKYEKGCGKEGGGGGWELKEGLGKNKPFKGKGGEATLHTVIPGKGDIKITCASFKDSGQLAMPDKEFNVIAQFKKCKSLGSPCKSEGGKKETIQTEKLAGNLGWIQKSSQTAGASLFSEAEPGSGYLAKFECEGLAKVRVHGGVIGKVEPVGVVSNLATVTYAVGPYLGEVSPGYTPLTNPPAFEEEEVGVLLTELNGPETGNEWGPAGGLPSGQETSAINKGEKLLIK
jgi:hypothetical protein